MKIRTLLMASTALIFSAGAADAGLYVGADAGMSFPIKEKIKHDGVSDTLELKDGWVGDIVVGWAFDNNFRTELDVGYRDYDMGDFNHVSNKGSLKSWAVTANVLYDFKNTTKFTPFVGAGIGAAYAKLENDTTNQDGSATKVALLGTAGISYQITDALSTSLAYRYFTTIDQEFENGKYDLRANEILLGLRYDFGCCKKKATDNAEVAAAAPVAAVAAVKAYELINGAPEYTIYFHTNSTRLSPNDHALLKKAAGDFEALGEKGDVTLRLIGSADNTGPEAYNLTLSERRADAAKEALIELGVPADAILASGEGAIGEGASRKNRRVLIEYVN